MARLGEVGQCRHLMGIFLKYVRMYVPADLTTEGLQQKCPETCSLTLVNLKCSLTSAVLSIALDTRTLAGWLAGGGTVRTYVVEECCLHAAFPFSIPVT